MSLPINEGISKYISKGRISFSMPGHKGNGVIDGKNLFKFDVTELDDTDNLLSPQSYIKESQNKLCNVYGTVSSHYLLGGSTSGIYSMISLVACEGDKIIVDRFCHKSVINAIILRGAVPVYIMPEYNYQFGFTGGILSAEVESAAESNPDAKAVIITSPTYYGTASDIVSIAKTVHKAGMLLLVDEAHGAHFHIADYFPDSAVKCGADMCVQSVHKTMGAFSGGALLHINTDKFASWQIEEVLSMYHTSSPSYAALCVLEAAVLNFAELKKRYIPILREIDKCRALVNAEAKAYWVGEELLGGCAIHSMDKTRIVINFSKLPITGYAVADILRKKYKIEVEMADERNIVCIATAYNSTSDIKALAKAVLAITKKMPIKTNKTDDFKLCSPRIVTNPRKACLSPCETVDMADAVGRIARTIVCKYPPGVPLLVPGEEICTDHIRLITDTLDMGGTITGIEDNYSINVLK